MSAVGTPLARAAPAEREFDVPAGNAESALAVFARQAAIQLIFDPQIAEGLRTPAVRGRLTPDDALRKLLAGTPLEVVRDQLTGALAIRRISGSDVMETKGQSVLHAAPKPTSGQATTPPDMSNPASSSKTSRGFRSRLLSGLALLATTHLHAQTDAKKPAEDVLKMDEYVVTGVSYTQTQFQSSFAVTSLSNTEIQKIGPLNLANLLGQVPGIFTEATGGEVQNVIRLRGIPNESSFQAFQVDGLPIYPDEGFFYKGDGVVRTDIMTKSFEIVRGGPSPIFASNAAAIYNNVTRQGGDVSESAVKVTIGDTDLYRLDGFWSGKIADSTYLAVGGFVRRNDGARPNGFPSDRGGQVEMNLRRELADGEIKLSLLSIADHNVFYLPIPIADPRNPSVSLNPYIDYFTGTLNTPYLENANFLYPNEAGANISERRDLSNGRYMKVLCPTFELNRTIGDWHFSNKFRISDLKVEFDALYSTTNPLDYASFASGYMNAAQSAFGSSTPVDHLGYAIAGTNGSTSYNPAAQSGLVMQAQYRAVDVKSNGVQDELRLGRDFELKGTHHGVLGLYATEYWMTEQSRYQDYLFELASNPRLLDLVAYSATNQVLGSVTDRGVLRYSTTLNGGHSDIKELAVFAADTWDITPKLKLDYGIRHERYSGSGYGKPAKAVNMNLPRTLAGANALAFTGATAINHYSESVTPWTVGANYDLDRHFGLYARASKSFRVGSEGNLALVNNPAVTTSAAQYEVGVKINRRKFSAFLTAFYTKFDPYVQTFQAVNPVTGNTGNLNFVGRAQTPGVEADITWKPLPYFSIDSSITYNRPRGGNYFSSLGADASAAEDKQLIRTPDLFGNIRPSLSFDIGKWAMRADLRLNFVSKRYVDIKNITALPAYRTLGAGLAADHGAWSFQLMVDNLTNAHGLTEGNPRSDVVGGQGTATAVYGRPLFGRSFRLESTFHF
ncbi:TonB-dependent receptor [Opitutaceae bacterium EW11]|nr:TonB-dependent receptor [Opitutaceae bacterium EW11]